MTDEDADEKSWVKANESSQSAPPTAIDWRPSRSVAHITAADAGLVLSLERGCQDREPEKMLKAIQYAR